ncbi:hypothetical protein CHLRE_04g217944v5 [Chlamydomonas reinhardtii]|uniref:Methyltransferase type 11 domain-containing protein n=1 Tax=Chlamydomonas reinhardtii TaxID=3055 RepID=A0A2K3DTH3_CHLRE|nr:uncharacterized protein CHLRE_04g217944v5 [Chlamydomonas reinhardtii]PNW83841.1 hypothetical protein CHLRE_04g217944v5 [Chlamydomonas reinhardtii]
MLTDLGLVSDSDFVAFTSRNIALLRHLEVPQSLWAPLYESLTRGLRAEDEPAGHVTSRRAHDESDADAVAVEDRDGGSGGSAGPFAGAFTCCWQDQEADQQQRQQQQGVRRRRVMTAARDLPAAGTIWAAAPLLCEPGRKRLQARLQGDTALLVRLAAALLPDDEGGEGENGDEEDAGSQEGETLSMHDTLLKQLRPLLVELVSEFEMPPAGPGLPPVKHKYLLPPSLAAMRAVGVAGVGAAGVGAAGAGAAAGAVAVAGAGAAAGAGGSSDTGDVAGASEAAAAAAAAGLAAAQPAGGGPVLAVAPFPHWVRGGGGGQWRFGVAVLAWPLRDVRQGEELTRSRLPLGLADFSSFDYWAAAYKEADATHEWYTEAGAMDTLMTALTRLAPPPPLPAESGSGAGAESESGLDSGSGSESGSGSGSGAQPGGGTGGWGGASATGGGSGRGSGSGWLGQRALVAGCGNSALGYQMWQQGYPNVDNVDYVPEVVRLMDTKYGIGGTEICGGGRTDGSSSACAADCSSGVAIAVDGVGGLALGAVAAVADAGAVSDAASVASYYGSCSNINGSSRRSSSTGIVVEGDSGCSSPKGSSRDGASVCLSTDSDGCRILPLLAAAAAAAATAEVPTAAPSEATAHAQQQEREEEVEVKSRAARAVQPLQSSCHGGAVRWLVGDLTAMSQTASGYYDLVVDKATLDALWSPAVDLAPPEAVHASAAPATAAGAVGSCSSDAGNKGCQWRKSSAELQVVFKYLGEMSRVTAPRGRLVVVTLRGPQAMGQMLEKAAEAEAEAAAGAAGAEAAVAVVEAAGHKAPAEAEQKGQAVRAGGCGVAPWRVSSHEELAGGRDGQALATHLYVLTKA